MRQGFASIEPTPDLYEVVELKNVKVFIVGDRKLFKWEKAGTSGSPIEGYANTNNEIRVLGKRVGDKIVVNQAVLGHELNHLLNFKNPKIANPRKLDEMGLQGEKYPIKEEPPPPHQAKGGDSVFWGIH